MIECERLATCRFFNETLADMPTVAAMMKRRFCHGDYSQCARIAASEVLGSSVPVDLAPNDMQRAQALISAYGGKRT